MARPKRVADPDLLKEMKQRAVEWQKFRQDNVLSQKFLAEIIGVARRTIQSIEGGKLIPQAATLKKFEDLRTKYEREGKSGGRKKPKQAA